MAEFANYVPAFYEIDACHMANYRYFDDWQALSTQERAVLVGHYFAKQAIEQQIEVARDRHTRAEAAKAKLRKGG